MAVVITRSAVVVLLTFCFATRGFADEEAGPAISHLTEMQALDADDACLGADAQDGVDCGFSALQLKKKKLEEHAGAALHGGADNADVAEQYPGSGFGTYGSGVGTYGSSRGGAYPGSGTYPSVGAAGYQSGGGYPGSGAYPSVGGAGYQSGGTYHGSGAYPSVGGAGYQSGGMYPGSGAYPSVGGAGYQSGGTYPHTYGSAYSGSAYGGSGGAYRGSGYGNSMYNAPYCPSTCSPGADCLSHRCDGCSYCQR